jgi:O-acetyl-ADP-ribose deacetylase (regulator of RNase III)
MLKHTNGNLIDLAEQGEFNIIVHGCNCHNTMGSGIAREIRERYPQAYLIDQETPKGARDKLGRYTVSHAETFAIVNAYTQYDYMPRNKDHFEYAAFQTILDEFAERAEEADGTIKLNFGFPYIGMGLAGGDPNRIIGMLEEFADRITATGGTVTLVEFT